MKTIAAPETPVRTELEDALQENIPCECNHSKTTPTERCGEEAVWRCYWICADPECDRRVENILLCEGCKSIWEKNENNLPLMFERL